uniref:Uncharacterized protein n=1 Tax=Oryza nivara TaxID=4536 RepID=A0A0E0GYQ0_ORYNI
MRPEGGDRRRQIWLPAARARCGEFGGCTASLGGLRWGCTLAASPLLDRGRWRISWLVGGDVRMWSWQDDVVKPALLDRLGAYPFKEIDLVFLQGIVGVRSPSDRSAGSEVLRTLKGTDH